MLLSNNKCVIDVDLCMRICLAWHFDTVSKSYQAEPKLKVLCSVSAWPEECSTLFKQSSENEGVKVSA